MCIRDRDKGNDVAWHWEVMGKPGMDQSLVKALRYKANASEYYLTSANGVSSQGVLINIDGTGNRLSATLYGPAHVFFIVGRNKIAATFEEDVYKRQVVPKSIPIIFPMIYTSHWIEFSKFI